MKIHRLIGILMYMEAHENVTANELAKYFEVSERTIYRDIDQLCEAGMPIYGASGSKGGYSFVEGYHLNSELLNQSEMEELLLSVYRMKVNSLRRDAGEDQRGELYQKVLKEANDKEKEAVERLFGQTIIDRESWWGIDDGKKKEQSVLASNLEKIQKAIYHLHKLRFDYRSYNNSMVGRVLSPYGVVEKDGQWYVVGYSDEREELRTFHCQRMSNIECMEEAFQIPVTFDLKEHWEQSIKQFRSRNTTPTIEQIKAFGTTRQEYLYPVLLQPEQKTDRLCPGFMRREEKEHQYTFDMISEEIAFQQLLPHLDRIQILEPQTLITRFRRFLERALRKLESENML